MTGSKIEVFQGRTDWYFRVIAPNGQIVATSKGYPTKADADEAVEAMWRNTLGTWQEGMR